MNIQTLRERVIYLRKKNLWSLKKLGEELEMAPNTLGDFLHGRDLTFISMAKIENYLEKYGDNNED